MLFRTFGLSLDMLKSRNLNFEYTAGNPVLKRINFQIEDSEFISILGESGSGKSTLLKLIYGMEDATDGEILFNGEKIGGPKFNLVPGHPKMKFVTQEFSLLETISVAENVGKYLSNFDLPKKKRNIRSALKAVGLLQLKDELPSKMSGGQRQRISIATALAAQPEVLLLDEPYGHLDQPLKFEIRKGIRNWTQENGTTVLITTHDINDAMAYSDRIFVIKNGRLIQIARPEELKSQPKNKYVAGLLGVFNGLTPAEIWRLFRIRIDENRFAVVYPEEISPDDKGAEFLVDEICFQGNNYLVKAINQKTEVYFYSDERPERQHIHLGLKDFRTVKN